MIQPFFFESDKAVDRWNDDVVQVSLCLYVQDDLQGTWKLSLKTTKFWLGCQLKADLNIDYTLNKKQKKQVWPQNHGGSAGSCGLQELWSSWWRHQENLVPNWKMFLSKLIWCRVQQWCRSDWSSTVPGLILVIYWKCTLKALCWYIMFLFSFTVDPDCENTNASLSAGCFKLLK